MSKTRISTGVEGLDEVLEGGLLPARTYLITGPPGTGKTTLGWHFLTEGAANGEAGLFITIGEAEAELRANAATSGFDVDGVAFVDLSPTSDVFAQIQDYDLFSPAEVERQPLTERILQAVEQHQPRRVFIDSMSHLRYLSTDGSQFRKQTLSLLRYLVERGATVMITSESTAANPDDDLRFLSDGVIEVSLRDRSRGLAVTKFRGSGLRQGVHTLQLDSSGATVFPRLIPESHAVQFIHETIPSGVLAMDELLHGGIERGTVTLISGPSGVGKTTLGMQFVAEAARRSERSAVYTFDERRETLLRRAEGTGLPVRRMIDEGKLEVVEIEALRFGPDEFASVVRREVEEWGTRLVMIDSVSGYQLSVTHQADLRAHIHSLCKYLQNVGVTVLLINELQGLDTFRITEVGISYLADNVIYLRYYDRREGGVAEIGKCVGVLKKRVSDFDRRVRPFEITSDGIHIADGPLGIGTFFG